MGLKSTRRGEATRKRVREAKRVKPIMPSNGPPMAIEATERGVEDGGATDPVLGAARYILLLGHLNLSVF